MANTPDLTTLVQGLAVEALAASRLLALAGTARKNKALRLLAAKLGERSAEIGQANAEDLAAGRQMGLSEAQLDRLALNPKRIAAMAEGVLQVAELEDPVGGEIDTTVRPNGLSIRRVRVPIGVIGIIYEARPNVTIDCAALCLKSGNAAILRGGREAFHSNTALARIVGEALREAGLPATAVQLIPTTDRAALDILLGLDQYVDCLIPRGGESLIRLVVEKARMPVIKHYKGVCTLYIDAGAEREMAVQLAVNAKCQRPGVCNAIENLFIHRQQARPLLPEIGRALVAKGVELRGDPESLAILTKAGLPCGTATDADYFEEYGALILALKVVPDLPAAIAAINHYGSHHSDAIVTGDARAAQAFLEGVDSAAVFWNASTRFNDGFEFGLGAEIGISTDKLHARGPMGLRELTTYKWIVTGTGQTRGGPA